LRGKRETLQKRCLWGSSKFSHKAGVPQSGRVEFIWGKMVRLLDAVDQLPKGDDMSSEKAVGKLGPVKEWKEKLKRISSSKPLRKVSAEKRFTIYLVALRKIEKKVPRGIKPAGTAAGKARYRPLSESGSPTKGKRSSG